MWKIIPWEKADWRKSDQIIAQKLGCDISTVWRKRKALANPLKESRHAKLVRLISHLNTATMTLKEIAKATGCSASCAGKLCHRLKKPFIRKKCGVKGKYDWSNVDWSKSNPDISKELGVKSPSHAYHYRKRHGIPPVITRRKSRKGLNRRNGLKRRKDYLSK